MGKMTWQSIHRNALNIPAFTVQHWWSLHRRTISRVHLNFLHFTHWVCVTQYELNGKSRWEIRCTERHFPRSYNDCQPNATFNNCPSNTENNSEKIIPIGNVKIENQPSSLFKGVDTNLRLGNVEEIQWMCLDEDTAITTSALDKTRR